MVAFLCAAGIVVLLAALYPLLAGGSKKNALAHLRLDELLAEWRRRGNTGRPPVALANAFLDGDEPAPQFMNARFGLSGTSDVARQFVEALAACQGHSGEWHPVMGTFGFGANGFITFQAIGINYSYDGAGLTNWRVAGQRSSATLDVTLDRLEATIPTKVAPWLYNWLVDHYLHLQQV